MAPVKMAIWETFHCPLRIETKGDSRSFWLWDHVFHFPHDEIMLSALQLLPLLLHPCRIRPKWVSSQVQGQEQQRKNRGGYSLNCGLWHCIWVKNFSCCWLLAAFFPFLTSHSSLSPRCSNTTPHHLAELFLTHFNSPIWLSPASSPQAVSLVPGRGSQPLCSFLLRSSSLLGDPRASPALNTGLGEEPQLRLC